jgi:hypothetical protein
MVHPRDRHWGSELAPATRLALVWRSVRVEEPTPSGSGPAGGCGLASSDRVSVVGVGDVRVDPPTGVDACIRGVPDRSRPDFSGPRCEAEPCCGAPGLPGTGPSSSASPSAPTNTPRTASPAINTTASTVPATTKPWRCPRPQQAEAEWPPSRPMPHKVSLLIPAGGRDTVLQLDAQASRVALVRERHLGDSVTRTKPPNTVRMHSPRRDHGSADDRGGGELR